MIIAFPEGYELSPSIETTRIYELERAIQSMVMSIVGARNAADYPREHVSPLVIRVQLDQALRIAELVL
jgi:hypothetical protein